MIDDLVVNPQTPQQPPQQPQPQPQTPAQGQEPNAGVGVLGDIKVAPGKFGKAARERFIEDSPDGATDPYPEMDDEELAAEVLKKYPNYSGIVDFSGSKFLDQIKERVNPTKIGLTHYQKTLVEATAPTSGRVRKGRDVLAQKGGDIELDADSLLKAKNPVEEFYKQRNRYLGLPENTQEILAGQGFKSEFPGMTDEQAALKIKANAAYAKQQGKKTFAHTVGMAEVLKAEAYKSAGIAGLVGMVANLQREQDALAEGEHEITPGEVEGVEAARRKASLMTGAMEAVSHENQFVNNVLNLAGKFSSGIGSEDVHSGNILPMSDVANENLTNPLNRPLIEGLQRSQSTGQTLIELAFPALTGVGHMVGAAALGGMVAGPVIGPLLGVQADTALANLDKPLTEQGKAQLITLAMMGAGATAAVARGALIKYGVEIPEVMLASPAMALAGGGATLLTDPNATRERVLANATVGALFPFAMKAFSERGGRSVGEVEENPPLEISAARDQTVFPAREVRLLNPAKFMEEPGSSTPTLVEGMEEGVGMATREEATGHLSDLKTFKAQPGYEALSVEKKALVDDEVGRLEFQVGGEEAPKVIAPEGILSDLKQKLINTADTLSKVPRGWESAGDVGDPESPARETFLATFENVDRPKAIVKFPSGSPEGPVLILNKPAMKWYSKAFEGLTGKAHSGAPHAGEGADLLRIAGAALVNSRSYPAGTVERTEFEAMGELLQAAALLGNSYTLLPIEKIQTTERYKELRRHEYVHQEQFKVARENNLGREGLYKITDQHFLAEHPLADKILSANTLTKSYPAHAWTAEAAAYAAGGGEGAKAIGLTKSEAAQFIADYKMHLAAKYGSQISGLFERLDPGVKRVIAVESVKKAKLYPCKGE